MAKVAPIKSPRGEPNRSQPATPALAKNPSFRPVILGQPAPSEIGFLRPRHMIVEEIRIVLGADLFVGLLLRAPIAPHSGPRLVEGVRVLDREDDFHRLAAV